MKSAYTLVASVVAITSFIGFGDPVHAQTLPQQHRVCLQLENSLASLQNNRQSASRRAQFQKYDRASHKQRSKVDRLRRQAKRHNCDGGGFLFFRKKPGPQCRGINRQLKKETRRLDALLDKRNRFANNPGSQDRKKREVLAALARNRCGPQYERYARRDRGRTLFGLPIFGGRDRDDRFRGGSFAREFYDDEFTSIGTFRTLCVRACDGYYFPISFSTLSRNFERDEAICRNMCPAAEVSLYKHRNPGQESEDMVSLNEEPYADLPNAFAYRKQYNSSCTCGAVDRPGRLLGTGNGVNASIIGGTFRFEENLGDPSIPIPDLRPDPMQDPETLLALSGDFFPQIIGSDSNGLVAERSGKKIRIVGPQYFYGRSVAEADQAPDRATVQ
ncbi:DUF2865 domain-containing protein [Coralliovum pocilloporae]|uniref:DUF2865 domain-containing protein n=1 Tax=Coralliovum pocilloporae TaxID=3066369 RepID=UPI003306E8B0